MTSEQLELAVAERRFRRFLIKPEDAVKLLNKRLDENGSVVLMPIISSQPIPGDAIVMAVTIDVSRNCLCVIMAHSHFSIVPMAQEIPIANESLSIALVAVDLPKAEDV